MCFYFNQISICSIKACMGMRVIAFCCNPESPSLNPIAAVIYINTLLNGSLHPLFQIEAM